MSALNWLLSTKERQVAVVKVALKEEEMDSEIVLLKADCSEDQSENQYRKTKRSATTITTTKTERLASINRGGPTPPS